MGTQGFGFLDGLGRFLCFFGVIGSFGGFVDCGFFSIIDGGFGFCSLFGCRSFFGFRIIFDDGFFALDGLYGLVGCLIGPCFGLGCFRYVFFRGVDYVGLHDFQVLSCGSRFRILLDRFFSECDSRGHRNGEDACHSTGYDAFSRFHAVMRGHSSFLSILNICLFRF